MLRNAIFVAFSYLNYFCSIVIVLRRKSTNKRCNNLFYENVLIKEMLRQPLQIP